jgi:predicted small metal-binding protein
VTELFSEYDGREDRNNAAPGEPASAWQEGGLGEQARAEIQIIEVIHGIRIVNKERLVDEIVRHARTRQHMSRITAALNSWVAIKGIVGETEIPDDELDRIMTGIDK